MIAIRKSFLLAHAKLSVELRLSRSLQLSCPHFALLVYLRIAPSGKRRRWHFVFFPVHAFGLWRQTICNRSTAPKPDIELLSAAQSPIMWLFPLTLVMRVDDNDGKRRLNRAALRPRVPCVSVELYRLRLLLHRPR